MGILDDAIREHLDLKRRLGAASDELERLEKEAFGPPSRPGDPDFPATETANGEQPQVATQEPPTGDETAVAPAADEPAEAAGTEVTSIFDADADESPGGESPEPEAAESTAQASREQESAGSDPAEEPAAEAEAAPEPPVDPGSDPTESTQPAAASSLEQAAQDIELDLDLDEEIEEVSDLDVELAPQPEQEPEPEPPADAEGDSAAAPVEAPIESQPTVEHHFEDALDEAEVVEDDEPSPAPAEGADDEEDGDGVLEETPEFLRENPDDDELWFEQGEPKDFDF